MGKIKKSSAGQRCRCCLERAGLKELWSEHQRGDEREVYGEMLADCFALPWQPPFAKTEHICEGCITNLRNAVSFKKKILCSDQILNQVKNESSENVKLEEDSDAEIQTEYLSLDYVDEDLGKEEEDKTIEVKLEIDNKPEAEIIDKAGVRKRGRRYTEEDFRKCLEAVRSKALSQTKASIVYRVPRNIIREALRPGDVLKGPAKPTNIKRLSLDGRIKHLDNITTLFKYTNATPIRCEKDSRYGCCFCAELFGDPAELKQHNIKTHQSVMDSIMRGKRLYDYLVKLDITGLTCNLCTIDLDNLDAMMLHLKGHKKPMHMDINNHIVPFSFDTDDLKCAICKTGFNSFRQLYLHMHSHYRNHVCDVCAAGFVNEKSFDVHYQTHQKGVFHCKYCQKEFDTLSRKRSHESGVHTNSQRFRCSYCSEKFSNSSKKEKHIRKVHNVRAREVKCKLCERVCSSMESLRVHTKRDHLMERNYECKFCNNKYFRLNELKKHTATHTGVREYPCEVCHKSFARKTALVEHMRVHADASEVKNVEGERSLDRKQGYQHRKEQAHRQHYYTLPSHQRHTYSRPKRHRLWMLLLRKVLRDTRRAEDPYQVGS